MIGVIFLPSSHSPFPSLFLLSSPPLFTLLLMDVKINRIETADEIARSTEKAAAKLGEQRIRYLHPDCGFWMLKRSVADRKIAALAKGRNLFLGLR